MHMESKNVLLYDEPSSLSVHTISREDINFLRIWKNRHRNSFIFKAFITPTMQSAWFESYRKREHDFMMVIEKDGKKIGCLGFRRLADRVDVYNVILGEKHYSKKGHMAKALLLICAEARRRYASLPIMVSVLKSNRYVKWYARRGFVVGKEYDDYYEMCLAISPSGTGRSGAEE